MPQIGSEAFRAWAEAVGLRAAPERLELLRREVEALLVRIEPLAEIDISPIAPDESGPAAPEVEA